MSAKPAAAKILIQGIEGCFAPFFVWGRLLAYTDFGTPNFRIVQISPGHPDPANWLDIVPESDKRIQQFSVAGDQVFVTRIHRFSTSVQAFGLKGERKEAPQFPSGGTIDLLNRTNATDKLFYSHTSMSEPAAVYCYDIRRPEVIPWNETRAPGDFSEIAVEETAYTSTDGTSVPLFLAARTAGTANRNPCSTRKLAKAVNRGVTQLPKPP